MNKNFLRRVFSISLIFFTFILLMFSTGVANSVVTSDLPEAQAVQNTNVGVGDENIILTYGLDKHSNTITEFKQNFRNSVGISMGGVVYFPRFKYIDCYNRDQNTLNDKYYKKYKRNYTGTCAEVATAIASDLILRKTKGKTVGSEILFYESMNNALKNNWFPTNKDKYPYSGTYSINVQYIMKNITKKYGLTGTFNFISDQGYSRSYMLDKIVESIKRGYPVLMTVPGHEVVVVGYQNYEASYSVRFTRRFLWWSQSWTESRLYEETFICLLNGWDDTQMLKFGQSTLKQEDEVLTYFSEIDFMTYCEDITYYC